MATISAYRQQVAGNVRAEMGRARITQKELGKALGISQPSLSRRLAGEQAFDADELLAIADHLSIDPTRLFGLTSANATSPWSPTTPGNPQRAITQTAPSNPETIRIRRVLIPEYPANEKAISRVQWVRERGVAA